MSLLEVIGYERGTLRTPNLAEDAEGVVVVSGFGFAPDLEGDACGEMAVYLAGKLVGMQFLSVATASVFRQVAELLATQTGVRWVECQAHAMWSRERKEWPPATLAEYEERTVAFYRNAARDETLQQLSGDYTPPVARLEGRLVSQAFGMSGGDLAGFDKWYAKWIKKNGFFVDGQGVWEDLRSLDELRRTRRSKTPEYTDIEQTLRRGWLEYLGRVWDAPKDLDPVARRAGRKS